MANGTTERITIPSWLLSQIVTLLIVVMGAVYVTGQFNGKFEEFRQAVNARLDRIERFQDEHR